MEKRYYKKWGSSLLTLLIFLIILSSCTKLEEDLLDPLETGKWEVINTSNGLPGNNIRDIKLDSRGDLWVACYGDGVAKFDGTTWTIYDTQNSEILNNNVKCIEEDDDGDMWFGTTDGISFLVDGSIWYYFHDPATQYNINSIKRDNHGYVWVGTEGQAYITYDYDMFYPSELSTIPELNNVNTIEEDGYGRIWLGTDLGIFIWDWSAWEYESVFAGLGSDEIWTLYSDSKEQMWIGVSGGYIGSYWYQNSLYPVSLQNGDLGAYITDVFEDRAGNIWFATWFDGVVKFDGVVSDVFKEYNGFPENYAEAIAEDRDGNIWIGTSSQGLIKYTLPITDK